MAEDQDVEPPSPAGEGSPQNDEAAGPPPPSKSAKKREKKKRAALRKKWYLAPLMVTPPSGLDLVDMSDIGKGFGLVATKPFKKDEVIVEEKQVLDVSMVVPPEYQALSDEAKEKIDALHGDTLADKCRLNTLPKGAEATEGGLFIAISRFNHSCAANAGHAWTGHHERVTASRDIQTGEEVCLTYTDDIATRSQRRRFLSQNFGFDCHCTSCSLTGDALLKSDDRRQRIAALDLAIPHIGCVDPQKGASMVADILCLLEEEGLLKPAKIARYAYDGYQLHIATGNVRKAKMYIEMGHAANVVFEGPHSQTTAKYASYLRNPHLHPNAGKAAAGRHVRGK